MKTPNLDSLTREQQTAALAVGALFGVGFIAFILCVLLLLLPFAFAAWYMEAYLLLNAEKSNITHPNC